MPERWMGVTVMQEGQVQLAVGAVRRGGAVLRACRRRRRAGRRPTTAGAWRTSPAPSPPSTPATPTLGRERSRAGFGLARRLQWKNFLRALAAGRGVALRARRSSTASRNAFVREVIAARGLEAARPRPGSVAVVDPHRHARRGSGSSSTARRSPFAARSRRSRSSCCSSSSPRAAATCRAHRHLRALARARRRQGAGRAQRRAASPAEAPRPRRRGAARARPPEPERAAASGSTASPSSSSPTAASARRRGAVAPAAVGRRASAPLAPLSRRRSCTTPRTMPGRWSAGRAWRASSSARSTLLVAPAVASGDPRAARALLERALEFDPLAEDLARELMRDPDRRSASRPPRWPCSSAAATRSARRSGAQPAPSTVALAGAPAPAVPPVRGRRGRFGKRFVSDGRLGSWLLDGARSP